MGPAALSLPKTLSNAHSPVCHARRGDGLRETEERRNGARQRLAALDLRTAAFNGDVPISYCQSSTSHGRPATALFRWLLLDSVAALCNGNDPEWRRYICGTEERCIGLVIGEILIDAPERVLG